MKRRSFFKALAGIAASPVMAKLPNPDGVMLHSIPHPDLAHTLTMDELPAHTHPLACALEKTREVMAARVLNCSFDSDPNTGLYRR